MDVVFLNPLHLQFTGDRAEVGSEGDKDSKTAIPQDFSPLIKGQREAIGIHFPKSPEGSLAGRGVHKGPRPSPQERFEALSPYALYLYSQRSTSGKLFLKPLD